MQKNANRANLTLVFIKWSFELVDFLNSTLFIQ